MKDITQAKIDALNAYIAKLPGWENWSATLDDVGPARKVDLTPKEGLLSPEQIAICNESFEYDFRLVALRCKGRWGNATARVNFYRMEVDKITCWGGI